MEPRLDCLTVGQRQLWPELAATPEHFTLYGGVAIALRLAHRPSADFDFFTRAGFDPEALYRSLPYLEGAEILQMESQTLTVSVPREEPVKLSFFGLPWLGVVDPPERAAGPGILVASLLDLAATKASTVQKRAVSRDYFDLDALLLQGRVSLLDAVAAARVVYGRGFNPQLTLKALSFFGDGDLARLPEEVRSRLLDAVQQVDLAQVPERIREMGGEP